MAQNSDRWLEPALHQQTRAALCIVAGFMLAAVVGCQFNTVLQVGVLLAGIILVGFPHGAFDHLVARPVLAPRLGRFWWVSFGIAYVGLAALVWLAWIVAPQATLVLFLAGSVLHFGLGDTEDDPDRGRGLRAARVLTAGLAPILLPVAFHPHAAAPLLAAIGGVSPPAMVSALSGSVWLVPPWLAAFAWVCWAARGQNASVTLRTIAGAISGASFMLLPPLLAFGLYFGLMHAPRHLLRLGAWHDPGDLSRAIGWSARIVVPAGVVCALGVAGLALVTRDIEIGTLAPAFRLIAALTLPHMIVTSWLAEEHDQPAVR